MTPEQKQIIQQSQEEIQQRLNKNGEYQGLTDKEEEMIDFNEAWNQGEQQARQQQLASPMHDTRIATSRRVTTISHQKKTVNSLRRRALLERCEKSLIQKSSKKSTSAIESYVTTATIDGFVTTATIITIVTIVTIANIADILIILNIANFATIRCNRSLHYFFCFCSFFLYFYLPI